MLFEENRQYRDIVGMLRFFLQDVLNDKSCRILSFCHKGAARGPQESGLTLLRVVTILDQTVGV